MEWLIDLWVEKQTAWDTSHSVHGKLAHSVESKQELREFFEGRILGRNELDLLVEAVAGHLNSRLNGAYKERLRRCILAKIRETESSFVNSAQRLQAEADLDLLNHFDDDSYLKAALWNPKEHYIRMQKRIILNQFGSCMNDLECWRTLLLDVKEAVAAATKAASDATENKAREFSSSLHKNLNHSKLLEGLVCVADCEQRYSNLDHQTPDQVSSIASRVIQFLPDPSKLTFGASLEDKEEIVNNVFESLLDCNVYPELRMRCDQCCPRCGVQCTHPMGLGHDGLHETFHQPRGNYGVVLKKGNVLCPQSCLRSAATNSCFRAAEGHLVSYREFNTVYAEWSNPDYSIEPHSLKVRELIFRYKQGMLHEMYPNSVPCPKEQMTGFDHGIEKIKGRIQKVLKLWNWMDNLQTDEAEP